MRASDEEWLGCRLWCNNRQECCTYRTAALRCPNNSPVLLSSKMRERKNRMQIIGSMAHLHFSQKRRVLRVSLTDRSANEGSKSGLAMKRTFEISHRKVAKDHTDISDVVQVMGDFGSSIRISKNVHDIPFEDFKDIRCRCFTAWNTGLILDPGHAFNHTGEKGSMVGAGLISLQYLFPCVKGILSMMTCQTTVAIYATC